MRSASTLTWDFASCKSSIHVFLAVAPHLGTRTGAAGMHAVSVRRSWCGSVKPHVRRLGCSLVERANSESGTRLGGIRNASCPKPLVRALHPPLVRRRLAGFRRAERTTATGSATRPYAANSFQTHTTSRAPTCLSWFGCGNADGDGSRRRVLLWPVRLRSSPDHGQDQ